MIGISIQIFHWCYHGHHDSMVLPVLMHKALFWYMDNAFSLEIFFYLKTTRRLKILLNKKELLGRN